jgi:hypothetical protein
VALVFGEVDVPEVPVAELLLLQEATASPVMTAAVASDRTMFVFMLDFLF